MTKLRAEEKDAFATNKRDLEDGIEGVRSALGVYVTTTEEPTQRTQLQVRAEESLDCARQLSLIFHQILNHRSRRECRCHIRPRVEGE